MSNKIRLISLIISVIAIIIFALAGYIAIGAIIAKQRGGQFEYFGYSLHVVVTDSMSPDYAVQDMVFIKSCAIDDINVGDDVLYKAVDPTLGGINILHRVAAIEMQDGQKLLTTQGIVAGAKIDPTKVSEIIGVAKSNNQALGKLYLMLTTPSGWIAMLMILGGVLLVVKCISNIVKSTKKGTAQDENAPK